VVDKKYKDLIEKLVSFKPFEKLPWFKPKKAYDPDEELAYEKLSPLAKCFHHIIKCFRTPAKAIGLGIMYSRGAASIAVGLKAQGIEMSVAEAKELKKTVVDSVPFLDSVNQFVMNRAKLNGYITTLLGRRGRFPTWEVMNWDTMKREEFATHEEAEKFFNENNEKKTKTFTNKKTGIEFTRDCDTLARPQRAWIYKALNKYIQGSSADQAKTGILAIYKNNDMNINALDILYRRVDFVPKIPRMQVHDEASFNPKPDEDFDWYQRTMENCIKLKVESKADMKVGNNWKECK
jgi:DNA polymerase I-like protein with 3'-5' exonuclease and polymerase domains